MNENRNKEDEIDKIFASAVNKVQSKIHKLLRNEARKKSIEWNVDVEINPARALSCIVSNICDIKNCKHIELCQSFRQIRDYFFRYGYIVYPYALFWNGLPSPITNNFGFFERDISHVLFVNINCFEKKYKSDPINSALNEAFHEFFHSVLLTFLDDKSLENSINQDDYIKFISRPRFLINYLKIYGKKKL